MSINRHLGDFTESKRSPYFWKLQIGGWLVFTLLEGIVGWILVKNGVIPPASGELFYELILLSSVYGFLITSSLRPAFIWIHSRRWNPLNMIPVLLCISFPMTVIELLIIRIPFLRDHFTPLFSIHLAGARFETLGFYVVLFMFACWIGIYFSSSLFFDSLELGSRQREGELRLLQYQMQPHFLFNALNSIMAVSESPKKVELITQSLADYLRFSMTDSEIDKAPLEDELKALDGYLQVEKIRFAENLEYRIDAAPETRTSDVPRSLVQPLLENAIKYGQQTSSMPLKITIQAQLISDSIHLMVENTGSWVERNPNTSTGIGLKNLSRRLSLLYGVRATIRHERSAETVKAIVTIPIVPNFPSNT